MTDNNQDNNKIEEVQQDAISPDAPAEEAQQPVQAESGDASQEPHQEPVPPATPDTEVQVEPEGEHTDQEPVEPSDTSQEPHQEQVPSETPETEVQKEAEGEQTDRETAESGDASQEPLQGHVPSETPDTVVQQKAEEEQVHEETAPSGASQKERNEKQEVKSTEVVGVRFRSCGKVYTFDSNNVELAPGAKVVVDSEMGLSMGNVVTPKHLRKNPREAFKKVLRIASEKDMETVDSNRTLQDEAKAFCVEKSKELNLQMKVVTTEITLDKKRLIFYFTADGRIDFRELVRDLAAKFKTRIEMRQIGVRDEVKMLGGIGACGRQTCCNQFLTSFAPVTIRMAKQQSLSINQSKLSGICGRLMCCLGYEYHDGPPEKVAARAKTVKTDTPEKQKEAVQDGDSTSKHPERPQRQRRPMESRRPRPPRPEQKEQKDAGEEKQPEKTAPARGDRKRRRRRRGGKAPQDNKGQQVKQETKQPDTQKPAGAGESKPTEPGDKKPTGRPGNKRKRFWKKKKKKEE